MSYSAVMGFGAFGFGTAPASLVAKLPGYEIVGTTSEPGIDYVIFIAAPIGSVSSKEEKPITADKHVIDLCNDDYHVLVSISKYAKTGDGQDIINLIAVKKESDVLVPDLEVEGSKMEPIDCSKLALPSMIPESVQEDKWTPPDWAVSAFLIGGVAIVIGVYGFQEGWFK